MSESFINDKGLTKEGASRILSMMDKKPEFLNRLGRTTWADRLHHAKYLTEIRVDDLRDVLQLPDNIIEGRILAGLIHNVAAGFADYGTNAVCLNVHRLREIAGETGRESGVRPR